MTHLIYQTDAYIQEFVAQVAVIEDRALALDRTAFYPGGGGQEPDQEEYPTRRDLAESHHGNPIVARGAGPGAVLARSQKWAKG